MAIPVLLRTAGAAVGQKVVFRGQPTQASIPVFVEKKLLPATRAVTLRPHSKVLVVVDREDRPDCPGAFAQSVRAELIRQLQAKHGYSGVPPIAVVCADRKLENWLLADPHSVHGHAYIRKDMRRRVGANADGLDAVQMLQWAYGRRRHYQKTKDAPALAARVRASRQDVRQRSKSLDKLLREAGV